MAENAQEKEFNIGGTVWIDKNKANKIRRIDYGRRKICTSYMG